MNVIHPVATGAYLYYDAHGIRGVSFTIMKHRTTS